MTADEMQCSNCSTPLKPGDKYCENCGVYILPSDAEINCKVCGGKITGNFCSKCGSALIVTEDEIKKFEGKNKKEKKNFLVSTISKILEAMVKLVSSILDAILGV